MVEIGLIASVVGVTGAALAASKALSDMIDQIRNAPEEIIAISQDTCSFHGIITNVQVAITDQFIVSKLQTEQQILVAVKQLEAPVKNCGTILTQMRSRIKPHLKLSDDGGFRVSSFNMRWIFQRKDVMDCRNRLETTKSTLNAALSSVVFLCHLKMMGSLRHNSDVLSISGLDLDAGSALREYAESVASHSPPPGLDVDAGSALREYAESVASNLLPPGLDIDAGSALREYAESVASHSPPPGLDVDAGSALREYAESVASHSPPPGLDVDAGSALREYTESVASHLPPPGLDVDAESPLREYAESRVSRALSPNAISAMQPGCSSTHSTQRELQWMGSNTLGMPDGLRTPSEVPDSDLKAIAPGYAEATRFQSAITARDLGEIELILAENVDVNLSAADGRTALHVTAEHGNENTVRLLIGRKADVNATTSAGWTPLHYAAKRGHQDIVQILLSAKNIDVNVTDPAGWTPLHYAAKRGHQDIVQMLLNAKNIDVNVSTDRNRTALHYAANMGHQDIVQMLLNAKTIDVNVSTNRTWTALHYAANMGHQDIVQMLLNAINIDVNVMKNDKSWTPLHCAAKHDHKNIAQMLLNAKDIDVNPKTDTGSTPLHIAARLGHVNIVKILLDNNADTNAENESHRTALTEAIRACEEDTAILLIRRGSPFMSAGKHSPPPLHVACKYSCPRVVKALIKKAKSSGQLQAMLEAGYEGFWPLHLAVSQDSLEITSQLIEAGADVNLRDKNQKTPLIRAATNGNIPVMDYLLARNAFRYTKDRTGQDYLQILKRKHPDKYDTQISQLFRS